MPEPDNTLLTRARAFVASDAEVAHCWELIVRGIEIGWLDRQEVSELLTYLRQGSDFGVEELLFDHLGGRLRVTFLDEQLTCSPAPIVEALASLLA